MLVTEVIKNRIKEECYSDLKAIGRSISDLDKTVNLDSDNAYLASLGLSEYIGLTTDQLTDMVKKIKSSADRDAEIDKLVKLMEVCNMLSIYWVLCNGTRFMIDLDAVIDNNPVPDVKFMNLLSSTEHCDFVFDFKGQDAREQCRFQRQNDLLIYKGNQYVNYIFTYTRLMQEGTVATLELCIVPDLYPKLFVLAAPGGSCCTEKCKICRQVESAQFQHLDGSLDSSFTLLRLPKNLQYTLESNCMWKDVKDESGPFLDHNIRDYLNACLYAIEKYLRRKTIVRKRGVNEFSDSVEVSLPRSFQQHHETNIKFVSIRDRVIYERKQNKVNHGSHHASPREHFRRPTQRHLKNGKVVQVKGCIINAGKGDSKKQTIYKIS